MTGTRPASAVRVAAAVILAPDGRVLLAQRPVGKAYAGYWEFPGGKLEPGETVHHALVRELREELGIGGQDAPDLKKVIAGGYQGSRFSFGYPACPDLEEQTGIAELLQPARIGVELSETFQWHPEQSTSAIVAHHAEARYFVIR